MVLNKEEYFQFLSNPQKYGVWCLKIDFTPESIHQLRSTFNLDSGRFDRRMFVRESFANYEKTPYNFPVLLPRIFAYLRSSIPKKRKESLRDLFPIREYEDQHRFSKYSIYRRVPYIFREMANVPSNLSQIKKKSFSKASKYYEKELSNFIIYPVPENYSKLDFLDWHNLEYFQVFEDSPSSITIVSPNKKILQYISNLFKELGIDDKKYFYKIYSPENSLMELYVPMVNAMMQSNFLNDKSVLKNISQGLDEIKEERFAHCIRAIGIGAEETLVEVYETFIRDKAKEAPLGNILSDLNNKIQLILFGKSNKKEGDFKKAKTSLGSLIENEKSKSNKNNDFLDFLIFFQKQVIQILERSNKFIDEYSEQSIKNQSLPIFPSYVLRCLNDLITLRNRVSHRIERGTSIVNVGYIESSIAIRSFIGLVYWWQKEKIQIDYNLRRKEIIESTIERSKIINEEDTENT